MLLKTDFKQAANGFTAKLKDMISAPSDIEKIKAQVDDFIQTGASKRVILEAVDSEFYTFDMTYIENIKTLTGTQIFNSLKKLSTTFVEYGAVKKLNFKFPNIIQSCQAADKHALPSYCNSKKN